ncbi:asparagine synthase (glutamine-hydrolysing) [Alteromonadaceae bacterium Bs31]|nr:asparagine synthase (glutamine-hydrolysing) [Alteromonadaceae bacterium Bs31]
MCGIFGIIQADGPPAELKEQACKGVAQLSHRGPDGWGIYSAPGIALGHSRLSIFDVTGGDQPLNSERCVLVYNGEIYNHYELRRELEAGGAVFRSHCDTEVVLKLYERDGIDCLSKLNGQFAFLLWDKQKKELIVARDRLGMRPLYIWEHQGAVYFSSEMKAFDALFPGERQFNPQHLFEHALLWNTLGSDTVYKNIRSLCSGSVEIYKDSRRTESHRYYEIGQAQHNASKLNFSEAKEAFKEHLARSVELRLRADVPVGAYLSGGIDSSVIAYLTKQQKQEQFRTFSVEFDDAQFDEGEYQRLVSEAINSQHESVSINHQAISDNFLEAVYHCERPLFRTAPIPLYKLSQKVRETDIVVVLTGEGADEILFGYDTFKELKILQNWKDSGNNPAIDQAIKALYPHLDHYADPRKFGLIKMYYEGFLESFDNNFAGLNIRMSNNRAIKNFLNKDLAISSDQEALNHKLSDMLPSNYSDWSLLQKNSFLEIKTLLQGYLLSSQGDRMALGNSIEGRYPFLDHELIDFVFSLQDEHKLNGFSQKHILKEAFKACIPDSVINRPKRPYMAPDIAAFFKGNSLVDSAEELLSPEKIASYGLFDQKQVARFLKKFSKGVPQQVGYRDNMLFIYMLSTQACQHWINTPRILNIDHSRCTVDISE